MFTDKKSKQALKYYCICKEVYRGKILNGRTVSLHRFPQNKRPMCVWNQRCRTVMSTLKLTENKLLCSEHFVDFCGPTIDHTLPSTFQLKMGKHTMFIVIANTIFTTWVMAITFTGQNIYYNPIFSKFPFMYK